MGLNYRPPRDFNPDEVLETVKSGLNNYLDTISSKSKVHRDAFLPWYYKVLESVNSKLESLSLNRGSTVRTNPFSDKDIRDALSNLHSSLVCTATDKCSSNISFICKRYYVECIQNELNSSFVEVDRGFSDVVEEHREFLRGFNIQLDEYLQRIPDLKYNT